MRVQRFFDGAAARLLQADPGVERAHLFNSDGLKVTTNGKFFAAVSRERLLVKLPAARVAELVTSGAGEPFHSGGRLMREWVLLQPADEAACAGYLEEARGFVGAR